MNFFFSSSLPQLIFRAVHTQPYLKTRGKPSFSEIPVSAPAVLLWDARARALNFLGERTGMRLGRGCHLSEDSEVYLRRESLF